MRTKTAVIVSIVLGILAVLMMSMYMGSRESQLLQLSEMKDVLVATTDILPNTVVDERLVQAIQVPAKYLQPKAISDMREVVGRVLAVPVPKGSQILGTYLEGGETALAYEVPRGRRAITISVDNITGVGGLVRPGNYVDIFGTFEFGRPIGQEGGQVKYADERTETRVLMQNLLVVAVNREHRRQRVAPRPAEASLTGELGEELATEQPGIETVTLLVDPSQAQRLVLAQDIGQLTLALRSNLDAGKMEDLGLLDPLKLLETPVPVKPRTKASPVWREIRGGGL
ncbi:MAG: Flp pilus assembly protein CpaB [Acidobacteria bacterium]|nr:Flp pilus assembly protein CpaB [Acidobacteriota bacterium]